MPIVIPTHSHPVVDTDRPFVIDPISKQITAGADNLTLAHHAKNSERFTFVIPGTVIEGHDMAACNSVMVHFQNIGQNGTRSDGIYEVTDLAVDGESVRLSWLIDDDATRFAGGLIFSIHFACIADDGTLVYNFPTLTFSKITVGATVWNSETIASDYPDILAAFNARIAELETAQVLSGGAVFYRERTEAAENASVTVSFGNQSELLEKFSAAPKERTMVVSASGQIFKVTAVQGVTVVMTLMGEIGSTNAVLYTPQALSKAKQAQIMKNIGVEEYLATELAKRGQLKPEFASSIEKCTDTSKLYVLPDEFIYAYIDGQWVSTGHKFVPADYEDIIIALKDELEEIRIGYDGTTYPTAGDAVRKQFEKVGGELDLMSDAVDEELLDTFTEVVHFDSNTDAWTPGAVMSDGTINDTGNYGLKNRHTSLTDIKADYPLDIRLNNYVSVEGSISATLKLSQYDSEGVLITSDNIAFDCYDSGGNLIRGEPTQNLVTIFSKSGRGADYAISSITLDPNTASAIISGVRALPDTGEEDSIDLQVSQLVQDTIAVSKRVVKPDALPAKSIDANKLADEVIALIASKVAKEEGKGLSSNDFTDEEKAKIALLSGESIERIEEAVQEYLRENNGGFVARSEVPKFETYSTFYVGENVATDDVVVLGNGWSGNATTGYAHASGSTEPLTFNIGAKDGENYYIELSVDDSYYAYNCSIAIGNSYAVNIYNGHSSAQGNVRCIGDNGSLVITPTNSALKFNSVRCCKITDTGEEITVSTDTFYHTSPQHNKTGFWNIQLGKPSLENTENTSRTIAIGNNSLRDLVNGNRNIGLGTFAMSQLVNGENNIAIGADCMMYAKKAYDCIAIGKPAMEYGNGIRNNIAIGGSALHGSATATSQNNIAIGSMAGYYTESGKNNVSIGVNSGYQNRTGSNNVAIGGSAGTTNRTGSQNIAIGANADIADGIGNSINIGFGTTVSKSNTVNIGNANTKTIILGSKKLIFNDDGTVSWEAVE